MLFDVWPHHSCKNNGVPKETHIGPVWVHLLDGGYVELDDVMANEKFGLGEKSKALADWPVSRLALSPVSRPVMAKQWSFVSVSRRPSVSQSNARRIVIISGNVRRY